MPAALKPNTNGLPGGHFNPESGKWKLAKDDLDYYYSSAMFYETGIDTFGFLNNLYTVFDGDYENLFRVPRTKAEDYALKSRL